MTAKKASGKAGARTSARAAREAARAAEREAERRARQRRRNIRLTVIFAVVAALVVTGGLVYRGYQDSITAQPAPPVTNSEFLIRDNTRILSAAPGSNVTFVEFLDFECEACGAVYPAIEQLREQYAGRVTFAIKYFPIESHLNSMRAARAVEAAAQQGQLEPMYQKMFETQREWGEQQEPMDATFTGFARELGLDMEAWEAAYNDPATEARIRADAADGESLQISGTPTFFVNGQLLEPSSMDDFTLALDAQLAGQ